MEGRLFEWTNRMPKDVCGREPVASVVIDEAVQGVMGGGGDKGAVGESGHRSLRPGESRGNGVCAGVEAALLCASVGR